jgi:hypothetical protein
MGRVWTVVQLNGKLPIVKKRDQRERIETGCNDFGLSSPLKLRGLLTISVMSQ